MGVGQGPMGESEKTSPQDHLTPDHHWPGWQSQEPKQDPEGLKGALVTLPRQATGTSISPRVILFSPSKSPVTWPRVFVRKPRHPRGACRTPPNPHPHSHLNSDHTQGQVKLSAHLGWGDIQPKWVGAEWAAPTSPWAATLQSGEGVPGAASALDAAARRPANGSRGQSRGDSGGGARGRQGTYGPEVRRTEAIAL